jgi:hypothetical protein
MAAIAMDAIDSRTAGGVAPAEARMRPLADLYCLGLAGRPVRTSGKDGVLPLWLPALDCRKRPRALTVVASRRPVEHPTFPPRTASSGTGNPFVPSVQATNLPAGNRHGRLRVSSRPGDLAVGAHRHVRPRANAEIVQLLKIASGFPVFFGPHGHARNAFSPRVNQSFPASCHGSSDAAHVTRRRRPRERGELLFAQRASYPPAPVGTTRRNGLRT